MIGSLIGSLKERPQTFWLLFGVLVLAAALRLYGLATESLWFDELLVVERLQNTYMGLLTDWDSHRQGPLFVLLNKAWCDLFGYSEFTLRFPAAVYGLLGVFVIYLLGRLMFDETAGLIAAFFLAINPFAIFYAQDARPYSLFFLCSLVSFYYVCRLFREYTLKDAAGYVVATVAGLYSHPYGPFLLLAHIVGFIIYRIHGFESAQNDDRRLLKTFGVVALLCSPLVLRFAVTFVLKLDDPAIAGAWLYRPGYKELLMVPGQYFMFPWLALLVASIASLVLVVRFPTERETRSHLLFLLGVGVCFVGIPSLIARYVTPIFEPRYTIPALASVLLILAWSLVRLTDVKRLIAVLSLVGLSVVPLALYFTRIDKDPWRQTAEKIESRARPGDVVAMIVVNKRQSKAVSYYFDPPDGVKVLFPDSSATKQTYVEAVSKARRVWVLSAYNDVLNMEEKLGKALEQTDAVRVDLYDREELNINPYAYLVEDLVLTRYDIDPRTSGESDGS